jgi:hypothetical protein
MREVILRQVKAIKYSQEPYKTKEKAVGEQLVNDVIDSLI